nr:MAG TPA: hypothetical protein [Bacteriophage sp.]
MTDFHNDFLFKELIINKIMRQNYLIYNNTLY